MDNSKRWFIYIMIGNLKVYIKKAMTTTEAVNWLQAKCKIDNNHHRWMYGKQIFCESK